MTEVAGFADLLSPRAKAFYGAVKRFDEPGLVSMGVLVRTSLAATILTDAHEKGRAKAKELLARAYGFGVEAGLLVQSCVLGDLEQVQTDLNSSTCLVLRSFPMAPITAEELNVVYGRPFFFDERYLIHTLGALVSWDPLKGARVDPTAERKRLGLCLKCGSAGAMRGMACFCAEHGLIWGA